MTNIIKTIDEIAKEIEIVETHAMRLVGTKVNSLLARITLDELLEGRKAEEFCFLEGKYHFSFGDDEWPPEYGVIIAEGRKDPSKPAKVEMYFKHYKSHLGRDSYEKEWKIFPQQECTSNKRCMALYGDLKNHAKRIKEYAK
jgi:hypothetical protein